MRTLRTAVVSLVAFTLLCGVAYPLAIALVARAAWPAQARGDTDQIGQVFASPAYVWGRPSAVGYDAKTSGGTNRGPLHPDLPGAVAERLAALRAADPTAGPAVPVDLVTASASGLDPHVSPAAARYQIARVARARGVDPTAVAAVVEAHVEGRTLGILGERRVNVVRLNRALDRAFGAPAAGAR